MATNSLVFEGQTFQIARRSLVATCGPFPENPNLLSTSYGVRSRASETHFQLFLAIDGATTEIAMENAIDLEPLNREFQFVELGRKVGDSFRSTILPRWSGLSGRCQGPDGQERVGNQIWQSRTFRWTRSQFREQLVCFSSTAF
jgi:hypothetical protein